MKTLCLIDTEKAILNNVIRLNLHPYTLCDNCKYFENDAVDCALAKPCVTTECENFVFNNLNEMYIILKKTNRQTNEKEHHRKANSNSKF